MQELDTCYISSDSNDTIIHENWSTQFTINFSEGDAKKHSRNMYNLSECEDETVPTTKNKELKSAEVLKNLKEKYLLGNKLVSNSNNLNEIVSLTDSSSEDEFNTSKTISNNKNNLVEDLDENNTIFNNYNFCYSQQKRSLQTISTSYADKNSINCNKKRSFETISSSSNENVNTNETLPNKVTNETKKIAAEEKKAQKESVRIKKKEQLEKEKTLKLAQKAVDKSNKLEECLKYIIADMDNSIFTNEEYGDYLKEHLTSQDISYRMKTLLPGMISWTRKLLTIEIMKIKETESPEKHYAVIIKPQAFGNLITCVQSIKEQTDFKHLSIFIYGQSKPTSSQEDEIMDIEMLFPTYWQFVKNKEELGTFIFMLTKSIAQLPHKLRQEEKFKQNNEYFEDCNRDLVTVNKDGNGLGRLWNQMLTMFPLVRLEAAETITANYPTLNLLFEAYEHCTENGEELMQNLAVRRAQGPLASKRKIGPELSKKCYKFFTSKDNTLL